MALEEKRALAEEAFGQPLTDEQVKALSEFVRVCVEGGYDDEEEESEEGGSGKKGDLMIALGLGPKSKDE